ncbi:MAG: electron transfer flavoprotein subunit alpha/FixB family protein [Chloroflexi bacterium]|nr:electron transfer flavoprotein subunit alpha/FixB family protein [Chloroflexota bacterium]
MSAQGGILVFSENEDLARELLSKARQVADAQGLSVSLAVLGESVPPEAAKYAQWNVDTVCAVQNPSLKDFNPEAYTTALAGVIDTIKPDLVLIGASKFGIEVSARLAERLNAGCASWCVDFELDPENKVVTTQCMVYSGQGIKTYKIQTQPALATVSAGVFEAVDGAERDVTILPIDVEIAPPRMTVIENKEKMAAGRRLEDAPVIVDVGMGVKERSDLAMMEELAGLLQGQVACSRPVSSDRDWFPEWLGLSGAQLSPDLCITVGISGAIQHMIGIRDSKIIVAVNNDENSAILMQSDYGVNMDLYEFIPALIEALKARSISLAQS